MYGRVAYTYGLKLDQPLTVIRLGYMNAWSETWSPFSIVPLWTVRGTADTSYFAGTGATNCNTSHCVLVGYSSEYWTPAYSRYYVPTMFQGTLLSDKSDHSGQLYRRNRYYDPASGRFTQEDPIGLAGGMNVYGFANGDPVNFSDPLGLYGCPKDEPCTNSVEAVMNQMVATATSLGLKTLGVFNDIADLFVGVNSAMTAGGLNPNSRDATSRIIAGAGLVAGAAGDAERVAATLTNRQAGDLAAHLGFGRRVKDAPFDSHGQAVFTNGKRFITQDIDMHFRTGSNMEDVRQEWRPPWEPTTDCSQVVWGIRMAFSIRLLPERVRESVRNLWIMK